VPGLLDLLSKQSRIARPNNGRAVAEAVMSTRRLSLSPRLLAGIKLPAALPADVRVAFRYSFSLAGDER
jgi:hypothetical protein